MTDDEFRKHLCVYLQVCCSMLAEKGDTMIVDYVVGQRTTLYRIHASRLGPILGSKGRLINAIRTLAIAAGHRIKSRIAIDLVKYCEAQAAPSAESRRTNNLRHEFPHKEKHLMNTFTKILDVEPDFRDQGQYPKMAYMSDSEFKKHLCAYLQMSCELVADEGAAVLIDYTDGKKTTLYQIRTSNIGQILGKSGRLVNAMYNIANASARYNRMCIEINVVKDEEASRKVA